MAIATKSPQTRTSSSCASQDVSAEQLALALDFCNQQGVRLTPGRRQVLELLFERSRPTGAYKLLDVLRRRNDRPISPPTVYRALEFLIAQGLVVKVESCNAYVPCAHPGRDHNSIFLICSDCSALIELEDRRMEQRLTEGAAQMGFSVTRCTVEVQGTCAHCSSASAD